MQGGAEKCVYAHYNRPMEDQNEDRTPETLICAYHGCQKEFRSTRPWQRFCQPVCRWADWRFQNPRVKRKIIDGETYIRTP